MTFLAAVKAKILQILRILLFRRIMGIFLCLLAVLFKGGKEGRIITH